MDRRWNDYDGNHGTKVKQMSFTIESDEQERFLVRLVNEPGFVHALEMAPARRESILDRGNWIVLAFAVWSKSDLQSIARAIEFAKSLNGRLNLGLRPFEFAEEFVPWCELDVDNSSFRQISSEERNSQIVINIVVATGKTPIWLCLRNGVILGEHRGLLDDDGLQRFTNNCFSRVPCGQKSQPVGKTAEGKELEGEIS